MVKFPIYITSHGRPINQVAEDLKKEGLDYTIVVNKDQVKDYKKHHKNVMIGDKGHYGAYNSIFNKHKDGDFVWVLQDNGGSFRKPYTFKKAFEELETQTNKDTGMLGFKNGNFHFKHPKYTKNSFLLNFILHQVKDNIRADPKSLYFLEIDLLTNYIKNGLHSIRNNDIHLLSKVSGTYNIDGGGNSSLYLKNVSGLPKEQSDNLIKDLNKKQLRKIVDRTVVKNSTTAKDNMIKKFNIPLSFFRKGAKGQWGIVEGFFKKVDKLFNTNK